MADIPPRGPPPAPPPAPQAPVPQPDFLWLFFRLRGRIGRQVFLLATLALVVALTFPLYRFQLAVPGSPAAEGWAAVFAVVAVATAWSSFALGAKRLHDLGRPGVAAVSLLLPFVSIIAFIALCVIPGTPGPNDYGENPDAPA